MQEIRKPTMVKKVWLFCCAIFCISPIIGCSTTFHDTYVKRTDQSNFRERVKVTDRGYEFASAEQLNNYEDCFPPSDKPLCKDLQNVEYRSKDKLNLRFFDISMRDNSGYTSQAVKDLIYLVGAEVSLQSGYSKFIVTNISENTACDNPSNQMRTSGMIIGNTYHGTTYSTQVSGGCSSLYSIDILSFSDYTIIENGIFVYAEDGKIKPFRQLYMSEEKARKLEEALNLEPLRGPYFTSTSRTTVIVDAWKTYYKAEEIKEAVMKKYELSESDYQYSIMEKDSPKPEKSIQEKYKITH